MGQRRGPRGCATRSLHHDCRKLRQWAPRSRASTHRSASSLPSAPGPEPTPLGSPPRRSLPGPPAGWRPAGSLARWRAAAPRPAPELVAACNGEASASLRSVFKRRRIRWAAPSTARQAGHGRYLSDGGWGGGVSGRASCSLYAGVPSPTAALRRLGRQVAADLAGTRLPAAGQNALIAYVLRCSRSDGGSRLITSARERESE